MNETTQLCTAVVRLQLPSTSETKQLDSTGGNNSTRQAERNNSTLHCRRPPAPPLQQNRFLLPTGIEPRSSGSKSCALTTRLPTAFL
ncbi:hypothetical protein TNCV_2770081 [Trichonephila clavipes]|nr:hypothetical protein TNCV_2770081 [Trichonephila clavipes]